MAEDKAEAKVDLGLLEEDDEFEEFPADEVSKEGDEDKDVNVWEDNWDDDKVEDDFANQLSSMSKIGSGSRSPPTLTPPPAKKRCVMSTPPTTNTSNGSSMMDLDTLPTNGSTRRSSRTSASSRTSTTSSPPGSPRPRGRGRSSTPSDAPLTPTRSSGRIRQKIILSPMLIFNFKDVLFYILVIIWALYSNISYILLRMIFAQEKIRKCSWPQTRCH